MSDAVSGAAAAAPPRRGHLSLGSNLGERRANLQAAITRLWGRGVGTLRCSSVYETEPVGLVLDQPAFLNACVEIETTLEPEQLLAACKDIERELGRRPGIRHGPRPIDIDVLLLGAITYSSERLQVPHPQLANRRFVLVPLLELDPELRLPDGTALRPALQALGGAQDVKLTGERLSPRSR